MSVNRRLSGSNGRLPPSMKSWKANEPLHGSNSHWTWRRKSLLLWIFGVVVAIGSVLFILNFSSMHLKKEAVREERAQALLQRYNVSRKQLHALASLISGSDQILSNCIDERRLQMLLSSGIISPQLLMCPENQELQREHGCVADSLESIEQCPILDDLVQARLELSFPLIPLVMMASLSALSSNLVNFFLCGKDHVCSSNLIKGCCLVFTGILMCYKLSSFCLLWRSQKQKLVQKHPAAQQKPPQHFVQGPSKGAGKWWKRLLVVFVSLGIVGSGWLFWHLNTDIMQRRVEMLANMCDERARMLQDQFNVSMNHVHALAILVSTFHHGKNPSAVDQKIFGEYTESTAFERPLTSGVAYAFKVLHSERIHFENQHGWTIKKMESENEALVQDCIPENLDPAPIQDEYAPVIFAQETVSHIVSIDMMSGKEDRENILRARASGKGVLTSPFKLLKSNHLGVVLTFAVYNSKLPPDATVEQRVEATVGYLGASYDIPSLVDKLLHQLASKQTIVVNVYDTTNASSPIAMYGTDVADTGLLKIRSIDFGDPLRKHEMHCRFKQRPPHPWTATNASVGVFVITLLLGYIFYAAINRIAEVEDDYRQMRKLKVRAEAAEVAKSQFLATVSHEIRTPTTGVLGMLQMLMDTDLDENQMDCAQTAHMSGKDLISVINEVLDQAKIEANKLELEVVSFDPRAILDEVLSIFSEKSNEKGIELAVYASNLVPEVVTGDPKRFRQIITNLVGNSLKFTHDKGHVFVSIHLANEVKNPLHIMDAVLREGVNLNQDLSDKTYNTLSGFPVGNRWKSWATFRKLNSLNLMDEPEMIQLLVTVEDTGIGIPTDVQSRIFTPFMQADSSTSRTYGGTGIGLSISKCLVDLMGGEIGFVSEPGIGSTFSFTGHFRKGEATSLDAKWWKYNLFASEFQGLKALVIDRRKIRGEVTRYHLQRLGISVDVSFSLKSACTCLSNTCNTSISMQVAMILIDKDSWDKESSILYTIKKHRENGTKGDPASFPKIFLLATHLSSSERDELKSAGIIDDILMKPLWPSVLIHYYRESLGTRKKQINRKRVSKLGSLLSDKQILVVDDNAVNRKVAEGVLQKYGVIVTCVESGRAALKMLNPPHSFDACFMDLHMPEMNGFEVTAQIRCLESDVNEKIAHGQASAEMYGNISHWHTPILAMTADVTQASSEEWRECGMDGYVSKPFDEEQLYTVMAQFFEVPCL
ncbi:histidine kinase 2 [Lotus japonicus]|uniref:histidine kinase 2 n=1 Tax=Lotus japonicus TaxID=34305 RepID=UPI00258CA15B|nr:histidine kinase 2 [Lotus japonicus]XP_057440901.1 histidine kinase 2 [Lotus japonicus]XP_057440902.1 histidine kinase 2 [Lotus japonicus]